MSTRAIVGYILFYFQRPRRVCIFFIGKNYIVESEMATGLKNPTEKAPYLLWKEGDTWIAKDGQTGISSQGKTRQAALKSLDEAVHLYRKEIDESTDLSKKEREVLESLDIDFSEVKKARENNEKLPEFMQ